MASQWECYLSYECGAVPHQYIPNHQIWRRRSHGDKRVPPAVATHHSCLEILTDRQAKLVVRPSCQVTRCRSTAGHDDITVVHVHVQVSSPNHMSHCVVLITATGKVLAQSVATFQWQWFNDGSCTISPPNCKHIASRLGRYTNRL